MRKISLAFLSFGLVMGISIIAMAYPTEAINLEKKVATDSNALFNLASPSDLEVAVEKYDFFLSLKETGDFAEISGLSHEMIELANDLYDTGELKQKMEISDIDFNRAVKIYMDRENSLIELDSTDVYELYSYLDTAEYIWEVPVHVGNQTVTFTLDIGKGLNPETENFLTEEQKDFINSKVGKWMIVRTAWGDEKGIDYKQYIRNEIAGSGLPDSSIYVLVGGIPEVNYPLAIEIHNEELRAVLPASIDTENSLNRILGVTSKINVDLTENYITFEQLKQTINEKN